MRIAFVSLAPLVIASLGAAMQEPARQTVAANSVVTHPFAGVTYVVRSEGPPHPERMHVVEIDLGAPGIRFVLSPPGGDRETVRQTTLEFLEAEHAQIAINAHYFLPFPSADRTAWLVGFAVSEGRVFSAFETPDQQYAIVSRAPAVNISRDNRATIVHANPSFSDGRHVLEEVAIWTAVSGSAQIVTDGVATVPSYLDDAHPGGALAPGGPGQYLERPLLVRRRDGADGNWAVARRPHDHAIHGGRSRRK